MDETNQSDSTVLVVEQSSYNPNILVQIMNERRSSEVDKLNKVLEYMDSLPDGTLNGLRNVLRVWDAFRTQFEGTYKTNVSAEHTHVDMLYDSILMKATAAQTALFLYNLRGGDTL